MTKTVILLMLMISQNSFAKIELSQQVIVDRVLDKSIQKQIIIKSFGNEQLEDDFFESQFDFSLGARVSKEDSQVESITGFSNVSDITNLLTIDLSKKNKFGTTFGLFYTKLNQKSILSPFSSNLRSPSMDSIEAGISVRQSLLNNFIGKSDRMNQEIVKNNLIKSTHLRDERLEELVLSALSTYWQAYVAKQTLNQAIRARDKYYSLVKSMRKKAKVGYVDKGELYSVEAEYEVQDQNVKKMSSNYLHSLDLLLTLIKFEKRGDVEFKVDAHLPAPPSNPSFMLSGLRKVKMDRLDIDNATISKNSALWEGLPVLDLVIKATNVGVDSAASRAFSEMTAGSHPKYFIGLEFKTAINSHGVRAERARREAKARLAELEGERSRAELINQSAQIFRSVNAYYKIAKSAVKTAQLRKKAVRQKERAYGQGRIPISDLTLSFNNYFKSETQRIIAMGNYFISLNRLAANQDNLIKSN